MSGSTALVLTVLVLAVVNVWVHVGPSRWQPVTGPAVAAVLLLVGRGAGLSWEQLGLGRGTLAGGLVWGGVAAGLVAVVYAVGLAVPATRRLFLDARQQVGARRAGVRALVSVPLGVVVLEEVAFRGVLWGLLEVQHGPTRATAVSAVLFGLWHVLPAVDGARGRARDGTPVARGAVVREVAGTVAFTTLAGIVFATLRHESGSLVAPFLLHWATNGLGVVAAAWAWAARRG